MLPDLFHVALPPCEDAMIFIRRNIISCLRSRMRRGFWRAAPTGGSPVLFFAEYAPDSIEPAPVGAVPAPERMAHDISMTFPYAPIDMESALAGILCLCITVMM